LLAAPQGAVKLNQGLQYATSVLQDALRCDISCQVAEPGSG